MTKCRRNICDVADDDERFSQYASMFGPTTGDRVRLGDTSLWVEVEKDYTVYGDECKFGGGRCDVKRRQKEAPC